MYLAETVDQRPQVPLRSAAEKTALYPTERPNDSTPRKIQKRSAVTKPHRAITAVPI